MLRTRHSLLGYRHHQNNNIEIRPFQRQARTHVKFQEIEVVIFKLTLKIILKNYTTSGFLKTDLAAKNVPLATKTPKFYRE